MRRFLVGIAVLPLLGFSFLDPAADRNRQGNRLFHEGKFEEALEYYRKAQVEKPDAPELRFNAGDAYFKKNAFQDALQEFGHALKSKDPSLLSRAYYNLGNVHVRRQNLQQAVEAYKRSLSIAPDDLDAKVNLEWVLEKMREQEKDQDQEQQENREDGQEGKEQKGEDPNDDGGREQQPDRPNPDRDGNSDQQDRETQDDRKQDQGRQPDPAGGQSGDRQEGQSVSGELGREEAERLLDAMKDREAKSQKYRRLRVYGKRYEGNEW